MQALSATMFLDREPGRLQDLASRIRATAPRRNPARPVDLLLDALVDQATLPAGDAVPSMRRALTGFCDDSSGDHRWIELASLVALDLLDDEALRLLEQALSAMGVAGFAARAGLELLATGEHPRRRGTELRDALTAQELNIARRVPRGPRRRRSPPHCS